MHFSPRLTHEEKQSRQRYPLPENLLNGFVKISPVTLAVTEDPDHGSPDEAYAPDYSGVIKSGSKCTVHP